MQLKIPRDYFSQPVAPPVYLCTQSGTIMGELQVTDTKLSAKWNSYSEFSFTTSRTYVDEITGETKIHPLFDKIEGPRTVLVAGYGYFVIQDDDTVYSDSDTKSITAFSLEYNLSSKYVNSWHINTGEVDSFEVMYETSKYGSGYAPENLYELASGEFDPYRRYYVQVPNKDTDLSPTYEGIQIVDEDAYNSHFGTGLESHNSLYVKTYENVKFYDEITQELSLLHILFKNIPDWTIGYVDYELQNKERKISEDRIDIYSLLTTKIADVFSCICEFDTLTRTVNFYVEEEDGLTEDGVAVSKYDTDVYISRENLASEVNISTSTDNIKTRLKVGGSEDLGIREVNLGKNYIMNLDYYHSHKTDDDGNKIPDYEWMEQDLFEQYSKYEDAVEEYSPKYTESMQNWVKAYNAWDKLMNDVPVEDGVLMIGDEFKKLYCTYTPIDTAYANKTLFINNTLGADEELYLDSACTIPVKRDSLKDGQMFIVQGLGVFYVESTEEYEVRRNMFDYNLTALYKKLNLYHVDEDTKGNKTDNVLLRLKNDNKDTATIRIKCTFKSAAEDTWNDNQFYYTKGEDKEEYYKDYSVTAATFESKKSSLYKDTYEIQTVITYTDIGANSAINSFSLTQWINGELIVDTEDLSFNHLAGFKVSAIGTLGAYFCLAKQEIQVKEEFDDETYEPTDYLKSFGVRLLQEKEETYLTIFQTQTEGMFSQEKYQCIASDEEPEGIFPDGTRWIKTGSNVTALYIYKRPDNNSAGIWDGPQSGVGISDEDRANYENYQRYIDNFNKLKAVQEVLADKEREAQYWLDGYSSDKRINLDDYKIKYLEATKYEENQTYYDKNGNILVPQPDSQEDIDNGDAYYLYEPSQSLEGDMRRIAMEHFGIGKEAVSRVSLDTNLPLYIFTTSSDSRGNLYTSKPVNYHKGDKWITGVDAPNGYDVKYIPTKYYIDREVYYDVNRNVANPQPTSQLEVQEGDYYVIIHYLLEAKATRAAGNYSDDDWGEVTTYAVYLKGQTPYVAYSNSRGVYQAWMDYYSNLTELESFFNEDQWKRLSPLIREDEFTDDNFLLNGLESEEERLEICRELMAAAAKELKTLSQPSLEFSMDMANILALKEFEPIVNQFALGNFIRIGLTENLTKKARLLEVNLSFDNLSDFSCTFGNLVSGKSEIDIHAELLSQAISAGKQVATSAGTWQRSVEKTNSIEQAIMDGLAESTLEVGRASGQNIQWGDQGIWCRKLRDGVSAENAGPDDYLPEQIRIVNNKILYSADGFRTSKSAFGSFTYEGKTYSGIMAETLIGGLVQGSQLIGGSLKIGQEGGTQFIVHEDGSVQIKDSGGKDVASTDSLASIQDGRRFHTELEYSGSTVFSEPNSKVAITCKVYSWDKDITEQVVAQTESTFTWQGGESETGTWSPTLGEAKNILIISNKDVGRDAQFSCKVQFDDEGL